MGEEGVGEEGLLLTMLLRIEEGVRREGVRREG